MLFQKLHGILQEGCTVTLVVTKAPDGNLSVAVSLNNPSASDPAKAYIQPFIATGTPAELDAELPDLIGEPLTRSAGLQTSMAEFEAAAKQAAAKSKAAAARKAEEDKAAKVAKANYDKLIAKAEALEKEGKYPAAIDAYDKAAGQAAGPDKAKAEKKASELRAKQQPSLDFFGEQETGDAGDTDPGDEGTLLKGTED